MAWIDTIDERDASGAFKEVYDDLAARRGKASNIMRAQSLHPEAMKAHLDLYEALLFGDSDLTRAQRELIGVVVSSANDCAYCVRHHREALQACWRDAERAEQAAQDYRAPALSEAEQAMADYAAALTQRPGSMNESDVERLRAAGFPDRAILDIALITSYFNFVNRLALGLGVRFTEDEATGYKY